MSKTFFRMQHLATTHKCKGRYPVSPATLWRWVATGKFPPPVKLSSGVTAWDSDLLDAFDAQCIGEPSTNTPKGVGAGVGFNRIAAVLEDAVTDSPTSKLPT